jgi:hypothetical protein
MPQEPYWEVLSYWEAKKQASMSTTALVTNIGSTAADIQAMLYLAQAGQDLNTMAPQITNFIGKHLETAHILRDNGVENVLMGTKSILNADYYKSFGYLVSGLAQGVGSLHSNLYTMLTGTDSLIGGLSGIIQDVGINPYISRAINAEILPNIPDEQTAWLMARHGDIKGEDYLKVLAQSGWGANWHQALEQVWQSPLPIGILLDLYRRNLMTIDELQLQLKLSRFDEDRIDGLTALKTQYPEPYRIAEMHSKALVGNDEYLAASRTFGLDDWWSMRYSESQARYPDFSTALALLRRGDIDNDTFYFWMQRSQVQPEETDVMLKLKDVIPPIQDLIRFAVREAYGDHTSEVQYSTMVDIAKKMGLTAEASEWYWYAHWDRIPVNLMFANYHRGLWDVAKLERMLKIVDIHPDDRQDIINVAYQPPNVRELGYGWDVGEYTEDDIAKYRRFGGLSPEDAKKAARSLVQYRTEAERNSVRTELMYAYGFERIDEDTLRGELELLNTPQEAIELWITRAELYRERMKKPTLDVEGRIVSSSEALTAFKLGIRDEAWTRQALADLDWTEDRIEVAIEKAKIDIEKAKEEPVITKYRNFTVADIKSFYKLNLITKEQMEVELITIGYSPDDAAVLTEVFTTEPEVTPQPKAFTSAVAANLYNLMIFDEEDLYNNFLDEGYDEPQAGLLLMYTQLIQKLPDLQAMYQKGIITGEQVVTELKKMEVPEYNARLLVQKITDQYQIDRLTTEKDLTKAEIIKGVKNNVLTTVQGVSLLVDIGYDENEAYYILAINKLVAASDPEGYWDMKRVTENLKKARGEKYMEVPEAVITLERQIKQTKLRIEEMKKKSESEENIATVVLELGRFENEMRTLLIQKKLS